jgi:regulator of cell morphogenesis and NO signaling
MKQTELNTQTIGEIVANDYRAASVFKEAGIDFCCGGNKTIEDACREKNIEPEELLHRLEEAGSQPLAKDKRYNEWEPAFLVDYIVNVHHSYIRKALPDIIEYTKKIASVHGARHSELYKVSELFSAIGDELTQHLKKEEEILFPAIKELSGKNPEKAKAVIASRILEFIAEHESAGGAMDKINVITENYKVPHDACNTYNLTLNLLREFEDDLHTHVHLENNIVFPKVLNAIN